MQTVKDVVPGYETDLYVHTRVFGKPRMTQEEMRAVAEEVWKRQPKCSFFDGFSYFRPDNIFRQDCPAYSTSRSAAFKVIDEMEKRGFRWVAEGFHTPGTDDTVRFSFLPYAVPTRAVTEAPTFSLAVCRAALVLITSMEYVGTCI
jgi:hypothetical protein